MLNAVTTSFSMENNLSLVGFDAASVPGDPPLRESPAGDGLSYPRGPSPHFPAHAAHLAGHAARPFLTRGKAGDAVQIDGDCEQIITYLTYRSPHMVGARMRKVHDVVQSSPLHVQTHDMEKIGNVGKALGKMRNA